MRTHHSDHLKYDGYILSFLQDLINLRRQSLFQIAIHEFIKSLFKISHSPDLRAVFRQARRGGEGIIKPIMASRRNEAWRKTSRKDGGLEILNRL